MSHVTHHVMAAINGIEKLLCVDMKYYLYKANTAYHSMLSFQELSKSWLAYPVKA
jgi:hypothetical protein